ncbi:MAG: hypothetical protein ACPGU1_14370 [Myxococcota bacterium]
MTLSPARIIAIFALLSLTLGGCGQTGADREKRISGEQAAIQGYSSKIPEAIRYQTAFADEWRRVNEIKDLKAYAEGMRSRVIPALEKYVAALRMMPTNSPKLTEIHSKVTQAYEGAVAGFSVFLEELSDENVEERYRVLLKAMETVAHAEKTYRRHLGTYYAANRVLLDAPKASAVAPGNPTPPAAKPATEAPPSP